MKKLPYGSEDIVLLVLRDLYGFHYELRRRSFALPLTVGPQFETERGARAAGEIALVALRQSIEAAKSP